MVWHLPLAFLSDGEMLCSRLPAATINVLHDNHLLSGLTACGSAKGRRD
jgi:hypothetical protein